jgi:Tol biopolymer transport system component
MRRIACILLAMVFLLALSCRLTGSSEQDYIVYSAVSESGRPLPELVVLDASGKELRRINLPADEKYDHLYTAYPFYHPSHRAFIYSPGGINYLIDITSSEVKLILEPGVSTIQGVTNPLYICPSADHAGQRWALLCRGNTPYLVNLETAQIHDVLSESPGDQMIPFKSWSSPDETYFAIRTDSGTFIMPAANPEEIHRLGESDKISEVDFSSDSKRITYVRQTESQDYEVIVENLDVSKPGVMHVSNNAMQVSYIPEHDQILVREKGKMLLLSLSNRKEQELPVLEGLPLNAIFAPKGEQALVGYNDIQADTTRWQWLDFKRNIAKELAGLAGYRANQPILGQRWMTLNDLNPGSGQEEMHVASLDLQTGSVQLLPTLENVSQYWENSVSADGKFRTAVASPTEGQMQLWLLDLAGGKARLMMEDTAVNGDISPDGKRVVVFYRHRQDDRYKSSIELQDTSGKLIKALGDGYWPFWVWP